MRPNKVLLISSNFPPVIGGSSVVYDQICRSAPQVVIAVGSKRNHQTNAPPANVEAFDASCGYVMRRLNYLRPPSVKRSGRWSRTLGFIAIDLPIMAITMIYLSWLIFHFRVKAVCIGELVYNGWLVFPLRYILRRRVILYTHGEEVSQDGTHAFARLRTAFLRHANVIIAVSLFCKSQIVSKYSIDPDKIFVLTNGIDLVTFARGERDRNVLPPPIRTKKILLAVARLVDRKGHKQLIQAMPLVLSQNPDAHCVIVGDGPLSANLKALVEEMKLENYVTLVGSVSINTLVRLYRAADVFVLPCQTMPDGDTEGFGLVFLEANACGLPVVAGAAGGTVEAVIDGETGLVVDGSDPRLIAEAVERILSDPSLAERLIEMGWKRAQQCSWHQIADDFLKICHGETHLPAEHGVSYASPIITDQPVFLPTGGDNAKPRLLVTIDVEEEFDWSIFSRSDYKVRGLDNLCAFHDDCRSVGVIPTYLLSYTILDDSDFRRLFTRFLADGSAELGIHLHSWVTPPFWEQANSFNSFQCNLPAHVERRKLETLCRKYEDCFGRAVNIHRAGRWGGAERTAAFLEELGIKVDLSPSAGYSETSSGGPDFTNLNGRPFLSGPHKSVLTLPASAINYLPGPDWVSRILFAGMEAIPTFGSLLAARPYGQAVRFSPEGLSTNFLQSMARQFTTRGFPVVVCTAHSTSLYGGGNPYVRDKDQATQLRININELLRYCIETLEFRPSTCADIYTELVKNRDRCGSDL